MKKSSKIMFQPDKIRNKLLEAGAFLILIAFFGSSCEQAPSMRANTDATPLPVAENTENLTSLEREIRDMQEFQIVLVIKRKDGGVFDDEDRKYLRENSPPSAQINRRILTDDEKAFVLGTNFLFPPENVESLKKRFVVEDYSKPITQVNVTANEKNANSNTNANAKTNAAPKD